MSTSLGWQGNHRSGDDWPCVTDDSGLSTYRLNGLSKGDDHLTYALSEYGPPLPVYNSMVQEMNTEPAVKNSSCNTCSIVGRCVGSACSNLSISRFAGGDIRDTGMWYSFFFIFVYVSFKHDVSNGGLPTSNVYLAHSQLEL